MTRKIGAQAEQAASQYLQRQGLKLITQNFTTRRGEIDLIMRDKKTLVFVEVRARSQAAYGSALESVTATKQMRLIATAQAYIQQHKLDMPCRFDVVSVLLTKTNSVQESIIDAWIQNAFQA